MSHPATTVRSGSLVAVIASLLASTLAVAGSDWVVPEAERKKPNPVKATPEVLQKGKGLYQRHCAMCHGAKGRGDGPASKAAALPPDDLSEAAFQKRVTDGELYWKLSEGRKEDDEFLMPGFAVQIPAADDRWALVHYLRSLGTPSN